MTLCERGPGHIRVGRLLLDYGRRWPEAPRIDGCRTNLARMGDETGQLLETVSFGGLWFRLPRCRCVSVGWRDARVLNPARWRPRFLWGQLKWRLAGRPYQAKVHGGDDSSPYRELTPEQRARFEAAAERALARRAEELERQHRAQEDTAHGAPRPIRMWPR